MKPEFLGSTDALPSDIKRVDTLPGAAHELYFIQHPEVDKKSLSGESMSSLAVPELNGRWVYYTDRRLAMRIPDEATYFLLRTARNRDLITADEQVVFRNACVGIAGLSVGSAAFSALVQMGGPKVIKLADPDIVEITNLNRMKAGLPDVGRNKTDVAAACAWELDPYLEPELWREGVSEATLSKFLLEPRLDVFVDEMDNIPLKIISRLHCKAEKIPVVMATDNGDGLILDVERFDLEPDRPIFHGRVDIDHAELSTMDRAAFIRLSNNIIDPELFTVRQLDSIRKIGKSLSAIPQLGSAVLLSGATVAYAVRQIVIRAELPSGRYVLSAEQSLTQKAA